MTSSVHLSWTKFPYPRGQFTLPESVYFLWCHNCNLKFYTILHKQISKYFLPLLETEENSHLPSPSLSCLLQVHFCLCMSQLVWQTRSPTSFRGGRKTTKMNLQEKRMRKGVKAPLETGRAVRANNVSSVVGVSGLPGYPGSQDMVPRHCRSRREAPALGV